YATKNWSINIKHDAAKNLDDFLGLNSEHLELKEACLYYQSYTKETECLEIIICTHEQQECGGKNIILQCQTVKTYLKSVLKEVWSMEGSEEMIRDFIRERKGSLENFIHKY
ncbi:12548_t:CDS:2, partial [Gigaspora margarita]